MGATILSKSQSPQFDSRLLALAEECWQADARDRPEFQEISVKLAKILSDFETKF